MSVTENTPMNLEEIELSKLLKEHKIANNVLEMITKQSLLNRASVSMNTIDSMKMYVERIKYLQMEIKVLALQNPGCLPEGVNRDNFDTFFIRI